MKNYIIYQITNKIDNKIYIGYHITDNISDKYMGSGININKAIKEFGIENFEKIILFNFDNMEDMIKKESELVNEEFIKRDDTYNIILGGGWNTSGTLCVKDKLNNVFQVSISDPRYLSGELIPYTKGTITVKDNNGNSMRVSTSDPRYLSGELIPYTRDMVVVKDKNNNIFRTSINDIRYISGELLPCLSGIVRVKDKDNIFSSVSVLDDRYLNGELMHISKNRKHKEESKKMIGNKNAIHQKGKGNSQYGTCWIYNLDLKQNKKIKGTDLDFYISSGWIKGRKIIYGKI